MSDLGRILQEINGLPTEQRKLFTSIFTDVVKNTRFGHPTGDARDPCVNFAGGFFHAVTPANAGDEFTIAHGFGRTPYLAIPVLLLDTVGSSTVSLTVSRAADANRMYFTSTEENVPVSLYAEG